MAAPHALTSSPAIVSCSAPPLDSPRAGRFFRSRLQALRLCFTILLAARTAAIRMGLCFTRAARSTGPLALVVAVVVAAAAAVPSLRFPPPEATKRSIDFRVVPTELYQLLG